MSGPISGEEGRMADDFREIERIVVSFLSRYGTESAPEPLGDAMAVLLHLATMLDRLERNQAALMLRLCSHQR